MRYSVEAAKGGPWTATIRARSAKGGRIALGDHEVAVPASTGWRDLVVPDVVLPGGTSPIILRAAQCDDCAVESLTLAPR